MAVYKLTTLFNYLSGASTPNLPTHRTGSFSESWYVTADSAQSVINLAANGPVAGVVGLWPGRAALLGLGSALIGYRLQSVSPFGPSQSGSINFPGQAGNLADVPQMALLLKTPGVGVNNIRRTRLKGVPDAQVIEGEFQPTAAYSVALSNYLIGLASWAFRARDLSQPTIKIAAITVGTVTTVTCETAITLQVLDFVRIMRSKDSSGFLRGGRFQVLTIGPGSNQFTIASWPYGGTVGGSVRKDGIVYPQVSAANSAVSRVVVAKVGRPFGGYRGRRSKRH